MLWPRRSVKTLVLKMQKEVKSIQKQPSCKKNSAALKSLGEKSCKIKGGGQEMAAMMLMLISFNNWCALLKLISINIIAAISWPPSLISQLFSPRLLRAALFFFTAWLFLSGYVSIQTLEGDLLSQSTPWWNQMDIILLRLYNTSNEDL